MTKQEIERVRKVLREYGDDFWCEGEEEEGICDNTVLFEEVVRILNKVGLDLKLVRVQRRGGDQRVENLLTP